MRILSAVILILCMALPLSAEARPSVRAIQTKGAEQEKSGMEARLKSMQEGFKQKYELRMHPRGNGMSVLVPEDWEQYLFVPSDLDKYFGSDLAAYYVGHKEGMEMLGFGLKALDHAATLEDADKIHSELSAQPRTDFEFLNKGFLHDYKLVSEETIVVAGKQARAHTYSYIWASVHWLETDIRIPNGNTLVVLFYQAPESIFEKGRERFETFKNSLTLPKKKVTKSRAATPGKGRRSAKNKTESQ